MKKLPLIIMFCTLVTLAACDNINIATLPDKINNVEQRQKHPKWWAVFNDPLMDKLTKQLIQQNIDIKIAQTRLEEAKGIAKMANSGFFPDISATGKTTRGNEQIGLNKPVSIAQGGFDAAWEIDIFGQTSAQVSAAENRVNARSTTIEDVTNSMLSELLRTIVEWRKYKQVLRETNNLLATQDEQIKLLKSRAKTGLIDASVPERARAQRAQMATQIPLTQARMAAAQYKIERLLGKTSGELSVLLNESAGELIVPAVKGTIDISIDIIHNRPDIRTAKNEMLATQSDLAKAEADVWPRITMGAFFGVQDGADNLHLASNPIWSIASGISVPLLNFGRLRGAIDAANARERQASLNYENASLTALQETKTALSDFLNGSNAVSERQQELSHRKIAVELANRRFKNGLTDMIDLTTAQSELDQATIALLEQKANTAIAYIQLQKALGNN